MKLHRFSLISYEGLALCQARAISFGYIQRLLHTVGVNFSLHGEQLFATIRPTILATPLIQAYQGEFFYA